MVKTTVSQRASALAPFVQLLRDRDSFFSEVAENTGIGEKLKILTLTTVALTMVYGTAVGLYQGGWQILSAALKIPALFLGTLLVCFPLFYLVQLLLGSKLRLMQTLTLMIAALNLTSVVAAASIPIFLFFLQSGASYYFLQLIGIITFGIAGLFGMGALHSGLTLICDSKGVYPRIGLTVLRIWVLIFAFVGIQMAWDFRPFLGKKGDPFVLFGDYKGNFYSALIYAVKQVFVHSNNPASQ